MQKLDKRDWRHDRIKRWSGLSDAEYRELFGTTSASEIRKEIERIVQANGGNISKKDQPLRDDSVGVVEQATATQPAPNKEQPAPDKEQLFRRGKATQSGLTLDKAIREISTIKSKLKAPYRDNLVVVDSVDQLPGSIQRRFASDPTIKGSYDPETGKVYVVVNRHTSGEDVARTIYHEIVGHAGLRAIFGNNLNRTLKEVYTERKADVEALAGKLGIDTSTSEGRYAATEEFIVHFADVLYDSGKLSYLINKLKAWWADITGKQYSDAQIIRDMLYPARGYTMIKYANELPFTHPSIAVTLNDSPDFRMKVREVSQSLLNTINFMPTLFQRLAAFAPAIKQFESLWNYQHHLSNLWQVKRQQLEAAFAKLTPVEIENVSKALLTYSATGTLPFVPQTAQKFSVSFDEDARQITYNKMPLTSDDVQLDPVLFNTLNANERAAAEQAIRLMAEIKVAETELALEQIQRSLTMVRSAPPEEVSIGDAATEAFKAAKAIVEAHNTQISRGYVPQLRRGTYRVVAESEAYIEARESGDKDALEQLRRDSNEYVYVGAETEAEAKAIADELARRGLYVRYWLQTSEPTDRMFHLSDLLQLFQEAERGMLGTVATATTRLAHQIIKYYAQVSDTVSTVAQSKLQREHVAGVRLTDVVPNLIERARDFSAYYGAAKTSYDRMHALIATREQIRYLPGEANAEAARIFNEIVARLRTSDNVQDTLYERLGRKALMFNTLFYLLINASYYLAQLLQPWVTSIYMAGLHGPKTITTMLKHYTNIKPILADAIKNNVELDFSSIPNYNKLLTTLQTRNRLDVGLQQEFGIVTGSTTKFLGAKIVNALHNAARTVEIINRAVTAMTAYDMRVAELKRKHPKMSQQEIERRAINYADHVVFRSQGDYSFAAAPRIFQSIPGRLLLQFKKVALVIGELFAEIIKNGFIPTKLSTEEIDIVKGGLESAKVDKAKANAIIKKLTDNQRLTDAELALARQAVSILLNKYGGPEQAPFVARVLDGVLSEDIYITKEQAVGYRYALLSMLSSTMLLAGTNAIPFATTFVALLASAVGSDDDELPDETSEQTIMRIFGPEVGSFILGGITRSILGIDISSRIGLNFTDQLFGSLYNNIRLTDAETTAKDAMIGMLGPTASTILGFFRAAEYLNEYSRTGSEHALVKGLAAAAPLGMRNLLMTYLYDREGLVNDARTRIIPPEQISAYEKLMQAIGFKPAQISDVYLSRTYINRIQSELQKQALQLKRAYYEAKIAGDVEGIQFIQKQLANLQALQRQAKMKPTTWSDLIQFARQKQRDALQSKNGIVLNNTNRQFVYTALDAWDAWDTNT